jgi:general secretion pathway protein G
MLALRHPRRSGGFTFIELLASAAIIGLLASVAVPMVQTTVKRQKERELRIALREIRQGIDAYKQAGVAGRIAVLQEQSGYPPSLLTLVQGVDDVSRPEHPKLYFLRRIPRDPFFPDANVKAVDTWGKRSFASPPEKPEEGDDVFDVYTKSAQTGLNGVPYREW